MIWILLVVLVSYFLVNSPLIYSLVYGHGTNATGRLWGYAPNQFLFLVLVYPFAAFASFVALRSFVVKLYATLPVTSRLAPIVDHWPVAVLVGLIVASFFTIVVYFTSGWSFDKLRPHYAERAMQSVKEFEKEVVESSTNKQDQEAFRRQLIRRAKDELEAIPFPGERNETAVQQWLDRLTPGAYLQVVQHKTLPHQLRLLDPAIHALNVFQITLVLFVAGCAAFVTLACVAYGHEAGYSGDNLPNLKVTVDAAFLAVFFFSLYIICYHQYRSQIEELVGTKTTIMQDVIVGIVVIVAFIGIRMIDPNNRELSILTILKFWPVAVLASGVAVEETIPQLTRQLIGNEATAGFQIIFSCIFAVLASIAVGRMIMNQ
jgi:hypothetical protein